MSIRVHVSNSDGPDTVNFPSAEKWHVDEHGFLHVRGKSGGNCATFQPNSWDYVQEIDARRDVQFYKR